MEETEIFLFQNPNQKGMFWNLLDQGFDNFIVNLCSSTSNSTRTSAKANVETRRHEGEGASGTAAVSHTVTHVPRMVQVPSNTSPPLEDENYDDEYDDNEKEDSIQNWRRHLSFYRKDDHDKENEDQGKDDDSFGIFDLGPTQVQDGIPFMEYAATPTSNTDTTTMNRYSDVASSLDKYSITPEYYQNGHPIMELDSLHLKMENNTSTPTKSSSSSLELGTNMKYLHLPPTVYMLAAAYDVKVASQHSLQYAYQGLLDAEGKRSFTPSSSSSSDTIKGNNTSKITSPTSIVMV